MLGCFLVVLVALFFDESRELEVTRHRFGPEKGSTRWRIAQVSDLHLLGKAEVEAKTVQVLNQEPLDLLVLTGDIVTHRERMADLGLFLQRLPGGTQKIAILGNWEYWAGINPRDLRAYYARHGVTLLVNESMVVGGEAGRELLVVGLDDARGGRPDWERAVADHPEWEGPMLILAHNPLTLHVIPAKVHQKAQRLMLAGHTHGGQIVVFGLHARREYPCLSGWCNGLVMPLYVSRGIGTSVIPLRLNARPELPLFEWRW
ncbi:MAG: metallophosphoesterase [Magnetococcales bacterium]|nr:metallophosphoesterase [Magnetococcales bacterium]